jgi:hypothetical protein
VIGNMRVKRRRDNVASRTTAWRQSVPSGHGTNRVTAGRDPRNKPGFVFITPRPAPTRTGEHLQPVNRLRDSRRLADQDIIRKVTAEHRLRVFLPERLTRKTRYQLRARASVFNDRRSGMKFLNSRSKTRRDRPPLAREFLEPRRAWRW